MSAKCRSKQQISYYTLLRRARTYAMPRFQWPNQGELDTTPSAVLVCLAEDFEKKNIEKRRITILEICSKQFL